MRKIVVLLLVLSSVVGWSQDVWSKYIPENSLMRYEVEAPGVMQYRLDTVSTGIGDMFSEVFHYTAVDPETPFVYMINHIQYPIAMTDSLTSETIAGDIMDATIQDILLSVNGRLVYQIDVPHRILDIQQYHILYEQESKSIKSRIFLRENHLYNVQVMTPADLSLHKYVERFLDSFKLK